MGQDDGHDPFGGFHFYTFDEVTKTPSIRVHRYLLDHPGQKQALMRKVTEILGYGDEMDRVTVTKRNWPGRSLVAGAVNSSSVPHAPGSPSIRSCARGEGQVRQTATLRSVGW